MGSYFSIKKKVYPDIQKSLDLDVSYRGGVPKHLYNSKKDYNESIMFR